MAETLRRPVLKECVCVKAVAWYYIALDRK